MKNIDVFFASALFLFAASHAGNLLIMVRETTSGGKSNGARIYPEELDD